jgi:hypothetical protein
VHTFIIVEVDVLKKVVTCIIGTLILISFISVSSYFTSLGKATTKKTDTKKDTGNAVRFKKISGRLTLPKGESAYDDISIYIDVFPASDSTHTTLYFAKVLIPKGKNSTEYSIQIPVSNNKYGLSYELIAGNDLVNPLIREIYENSGYLCKKGMVPGDKKINEVDIKTFYMRDNLKQDLVLMPNEIVGKGIKDILNKTIKPGMSDFEKETAIYKYVVKNYKYDYYRAYQMLSIQYEPKAYYTEHYNESGLERVFISKKAICGEYAELMKLLLNKANIECETIIGGLKGVAPHEWDIVKIGGNYYQLDASADQEKYMEDAYEHLNYTDQSFLVYFSPFDNNNKTSSTYPKCNSYEYNYKFRKYWVDNKLKIGEVKNINGVVSLPNGEVAPENGRIIYIEATTGNDTIDKKDDFKNYTNVVIEKGSNHAKFSLPMVLTNKEYIVNAMTQDKNILIGVKTVNKNEADSKNITINLQKPSTIKGTISLPQGSKPLNWDMRIYVFLKLDNGNKDRSFSDIWYRSQVMLRKGQREAQFNMPVMNSNKPYILSYQILDNKDFDEYLNIAYYNSKGSTSVYNSSTKIYTSKLEQPLNLIIKKK